MGDQKFTGASITRVPLTFLDKVIGYADVTLNKLDDQDEQWEMVTHSLAGENAFEVQAFITDENAKRLFDAFRLTDVSLEIQPQPTFQKEGANDEETRRVE